MTAPAVTRTCQPDTFTSAALVGALEDAWAAIRSRHPEIPTVVVIVGSGSSPSKKNELTYGHFASLRWQHGDTQLPEVLVSGEGLRRTPAEVFTTLLHEATHALADVRGIQETSRQGRWHNKKFAVLATELGLIASKDPRLGWSPCDLHANTIDHYRPALDHLATVMRAFRHPEDTNTGTRTNNNNGLTLTCDCPRKLRVSIKVAEAGPIVCAVCDSTFLTDTQRDEGDDPRRNSQDLSSPGEDHGGLPTFSYRSAPEGFATRRQLAALGLQPGRQPIAARIVWCNNLRFAYLYRTDLARPKRPATAAQLAALAKANLVLRTCTGCGHVADHVIPRRHGVCLDCATESAAA